MEALAYLIIYLKSDKTDSSVMLKGSSWAPIGAGVCNVVLNVFVMLMALTDLLPSFIYPVCGSNDIFVARIQRENALVAMAGRRHWDCRCCFTFNIKMIIKIRLKTAIGYR